MCVHSPPLPKPLAAGKRSAHSLWTRPFRDAWALLMDTAPKLGDLDRTIAFAIDDRLVNRDTTLQNGHTLALLPPVSGG